MSKAHVAGSLYHPFSYVTVLFKISKKVQFREAAALPFVSKAKISKKNLGRTFKKVDFIL